MISAGEKIAAVDSPECGVPIMLRSLLEVVTGLQRSAYCRSVVLKTNGRLKVQGKVNRVLTGICSDLPLLCHGRQVSAVPLLNYLFIAIFCELLRVDTAQTAEQRGQETRAASNDRKSACSRYGFRPLWNHQVRGSDN